MNNNDQQKLFESYMKINEDLGLGPKQDGKGIVSAPSIGSSGKPGVGHMDPAKSSMTPTTGASEDEELPIKIETMVENIKLSLDHLVEQYATSPNEVAHALAEALQVFNESLDRVFRGPYKEKPDKQ